MQLSWQRRASAVRPALYRHWEVWCKQHFENTRSHFEAMCEAGNCQAMQLLPDIGKWRCKILADVSRMPDLCTPRIKFPEKLSLISGFSAANRARLPLPLPSQADAWGQLHQLAQSYRSLCLTTCQWAWNFWEIKANPLTSWVGTASSKAASQTHLAF